MQTAANHEQADREREGAYRRGYHQAIAEVAHLFENSPSLSATDLSQWVETAGMAWRKDQPLDQMIPPPPIR